MIFLMLERILIGQEESANDKELMMINQIGTACLVSQQLIDIGMTPYGISLGLREANPIAKPFSSSYRTMIPVGLLFLAAEIPILFKFQRKYPSLYAVAIISANAAYAMILVDNMLKISRRM